MTSVRTQHNSFQTLHRCSTCANMTIWFLCNINVIITESFVFCKSEITIECHTAHNKVKFWNGVYRFPKLVSLMILLGGLLGVYFQLVLCRHCCLMVRLNLIKNLKFRKTETHENLVFCGPRLLETSHKPYLQQFKPKQKSWKNQSMWFYLGNSTNPGEPVSFGNSNLQKRLFTYVLKWQLFLHSLLLTASLCTRHNFKQHL